VERGDGVVAEGDVAESDGWAEGEPDADACAVTDASGEGEVAGPAAESDPEESLHPVSNRIPPSSAAAIETPLNPDNVTLLLGR
ncbi:hypothetical protein PV341_31915, partial [Streptomyces sp. PA03-1a]|nr:hypothetical protein [Streptomyces sp. PA03-1a]